MKRNESMAEMVPIELDKPRNIVLGIEAFVAIEEKLPGVNTLDLSFWKTMSATRARVVLWAGLLDESPDLKFEDMKNVLKGQDLGPIVQKLLKAYGLATPERKEGEESTDPQQPEPLPSPSDGANSGPSVVST